MRYSASDKYEIIQLVQNSDLSVGQTPKPQAIWNKVIEEHREAIVEFALEKPELSPRELAVSYTDEKA